MPFTKQEDRKKIGDLSELGVRNLLITRISSISDFAVGDKCYYFYNIMMKVWKNNRRWTVAHSIYQEMIERINKHTAWADDTKRAYELAWQVFFQLQVMPYELEKQAENGDIKGDDLSVN